MEYQKSEINTVKRGSRKASYDKEVVHEILDASEVCFLAFVLDGKAMVQPINFGRKGEKIYLHGSLKNRMTNTLVESGEVSLTVMMLDSMKLTRSAYHHSVNFRSVAIQGSVRDLKTDEEKLVGLKAIINHFVLNRWEHLAPNQKELKATKVIEITIEWAAAKIADSPPEDKKEDMDSDYWSGSIPIKTICEFPVNDEKLKEGFEIPQHVVDFYEKRKGGF